MAEKKLYICDDCNYGILVDLDAPAPTKCPNCGGSSLTLEEVGGVMTIPQDEEEE